MYLFRSQKQKEVSYKDFLETLKQVGASDCKTLFIHNDIMFGNMNPEIGRKEFMQTLINLFYDLNVENIIMPAFTYSFNNEKDFDVIKSRSLMGSLSEAFRKEPEVYRTLDPMTSFAIKGNLADDFEKYKSECNSLGVGSYFDLLNKQDDVKYLFFGADLAESFTYVHYVERILNVPYRFDMNFTGKIIDYSANEKHTNWIISTQCGGVQLYEKNEHFKKDLQYRGLLKLAPIGDKEISCISQDDARKQIIENIENNKFYFLKKPYEEKDLTHVYVMKHDGQPVTHC